VSISTKIYVNLLVRKCLNRLGAYAGSTFLEPARGTCVVIIIYG